jgi:hypothetical protein
VKACDTITPERAEAAGRPREHYTLQPHGARALRDAYSGLQALAGGSLATLAEISKGG